jgi:tRNA threonylcarbamoyladenosine biosynthesis protein TsaE
VGVAAGVVDRPVNLEALAHEAAQLWRTIRPGGVVWLSGEMGTGKTTFVQAVTRAAGALPARSPTYALVHQYASPEGIILHVDCYRLRHPDEARDLDLDRMARDSRLLLIEWPERAGRHAPPPDVHIRLRHAGSPDTRLMETVA